MNCPKCSTGVLETIGYIELVTGKLQIQLSPIVPEHTAAIGIKLCSKDSCGHVEWVAAPESLSLAKRSFRDALYMAKRAAR